MPTSSLLFNLVAHDMCLIQLLSGIMLKSMLNFIKRSRTLECELLTSNPYHNYFIFITFL